MNKFLLLISFLIISLLSFSQNPTMQGGGNRSGAGGGGGQMPNGRFYGKIVDGKTGKAIEFASIELYQNKLDTVTKQRAEKLVTGMLTKANGEFSLENVPAMAQSKIKITAIGFKDLEKNVAFDLKSG